jgi:uncharacterized membrane protein YdjX (TVP38/TMEM64 family)
MKKKNKNFNFYKNFVENDMKDKISILVSALLIIGLFVFMSWLFRVYQDEIQRMITINPITGVLIYIIVFILSIVFAPIGVLPLIPIAVQLWGVLAATILSTLGWTIGAMIAFFIARKLGKPYVRKIISLKQIEKIEKTIPEKNIFWSIFFLRTVTPFDGVSYVLGLITKVSAPTFFWATLLGLLPFCLVISFLGSLPIIVLIIGLILAVLLIFLGLYAHKIDRKDKDNA